MQPRGLYFVKSYFASYSGLPKECYYGFFFSLIGNLSFGIYYYLPIYFVDFLHFNMAKAGMIVSCYGLGSMLGGMAGGRLSDRWSPERVSSICLLLQAIAYVAFLEFQSVLFLMCNVFLLGTLSYGFITANQLFVLNYCGEDKDQRLKAINIVSTTSNLGLGLMALIFSAIYSLGFQNIFILTASVLFILAYLSFILCRQMDLKTHQSINDQQSIAEKNCAELTDRKSTKQIMLFILFNVFFVGLIVAQLSTTYSIHIRETYPEWGINAITLLFALNTFMVVLLSPLCGDYIKQFNQIMMVGIGGFLLGCGMFMLIFKGPFIIAVAACAIYTIGEIIFFSVAQLVCYENSLQGQRGKNLGLYRMVYASSRVLGPAMGGMVYHQFGGNVVWFVSGAIGLFCLSTSGYFKRLN